MTRRADVRVRLTAQQLRDVDYLVRFGRIGSTRSEVIAYFLTVGLERYATAEKLQKRDNK